jgi:hypothetical protein
MALFLLLVCNLQQGDGEKRASMGELGSRSAELFDPTGQRRAAGHDIVLRLAF